MTHRRAWVFLWLGLLGLLLSLPPNLITLATNDMQDYIPLLVASLTLALVAGALLLPVLLRAAPGWRIVAALLAVPLLWNGCSALSRLVSINR